jgi:hypothetical protein
LPWAYFCLNSRLLNPFSWWNPITAAAYLPFPSSAPKFGTEEGNLQHRASPLICPPVVISVIAVVHLQVFGKEKIAK